MMHVVLAILGICTALSQGAVAATRLGLHVTQEELTIWRQRMTDNVNTINGFTYQSIYQNRILPGANAFRSQSHPGNDGFWVGHTGGGCAPGLITTQDTGHTPYGRGNGAYLARSAFVFLLTGDTSYANPVRTELLNQVAQAGTDFSNSSKWCTTNLVDGVYVRAFEIVPWIFRLLLAYDYLQAGGYTGFSAGEITSINTWFLNAANFWHSMQALATSFGGYPGLFNTPQDLTCVGGCTDPGALLYLNGPTMRNPTSNWFFNQGTLAPMLSMAVGVKLNNTTHMTNAIKWITAFIKVGIWDNGAMSDWARWNDCNPGCPGGMWGHAGGALGAITTAIDLLARTGDTSLYTLSGPTQVLGGSGTAVSYQTTLDLWAKMANKTVLLYALPSAAPAQLLTWDSDNASPNTGNYHDFSSMAANLFYQNSAIHTAMTRTALGTNGTQQPNSCNDSQYGGCFSGQWGFWPDVPFMSGNMEGKVNPYGESNGTKPSPPSNLHVISTQ
jgi:hypothetical protein